MPVKLLLDEDLSPSVAVALCGDGIDACHVRILIEDATLKRDVQLAVIRAAVAYIEGNDMVNRVLWVNLDGAMEFEDIPQG